MAIVFMDSAAHYSGAEKWNGGDSTGKANSSPRVPGGWYHSPFGHMTFWLPSTLQTIIVGFGFRPNSMGPPIFRLGQGSGGGGGDGQLQFYSGTGGKITVLRGSNFTAPLLTESATGFLTAGAWHHIEVKAFIHDTQGTLEVRVNGITAINVSNVDTKATAAAYVDYVAWGFGTGGEQPSMDVSDVYIADTSGSTNNDIGIGDCAVECLHPNGNGNSSQWDGSDGNQTDNYLLVDERVPNGDTDYVLSADIGDKDTYAFDPLDFNGTVLSVQTLAYAKKDSSGSRSIVVVNRSGATESDGPVSALLDSYTYHRRVSDTKPGGGAWTVADVNAAEFGVKVNA